MFFVTWLFRILGIPTIGATKKNSNIPRFLMELYNIIDYYGVT